MVKPRQELLGNINNLDKDLTGTVTLNNANIQSTKSIIFYPIGLAPAVNSVWVESGATTYLKFTDNNGNTITLGSGSPAQSWSDVLSIDPYSNGYNPIISNGDYLYFKKIDSSNISISSDGYNLNINGSDNIIFELSNGFILRFPQNDGYYGYALTTDGYGNLSFNPTTNTPLSDVISPNIDASIAVVGTDGYAARAGHTHQVNVDSPVDLIVGGSNIDGYSSYLARADHIHALPAFGTIAGTFTEGNDSRLSDDRTASGLRTATTIVSISSAIAPVAGQALIANSSTGASWQPVTSVTSTTSPSNVTKSAAVIGTDGYAARADHKHDISTSVAMTLSPGDIASEGTAQTLARSDHIHGLPAFGTIAGTFAQGNDSRFINPGTDGYILSTQSGLVTWSGRVNIGSTVSVIPTSSFDSKVVFDNYTVGSPRAWLIPYGTTPTTTNFCIDGNGSVSRLNGSVNSILSVSGSTVLFADATGVGLYKPLVFQANVIAPAIKQNANPTGNGQPLEMYAQQSGDSAGGNLNLHSGLGSTIDGYINLYTGNNIRAAINTSIELYPTIGSNKIIINDSGTSGSVAQWMLPVATSASTGNWAIKSNGSTSYINGSSSSGLYVNDTLKLSASSTTIGVYNSSIAFDPILSPVSIFQYATAAGDGSDFSISAQTSVIASGGDLILSSGSGTSYLTDGYWKARTGSSDRISISPSEVSIYPLSGTNKIIIGDTSGAVTQWMLPDATSKTASNYAIISNGSNTYINGTTSVHFRLNNNSSAYISGSGFVFNTAQVSFSSDLPSPTITQFTKSSGAGETLVLQAQSSSDNTGGILRLRSGTGVTTNGALQLWTGATQRFEASDFVTINPTTAADSKAVFANYGTGTPALWLGPLALTPTGSNYAITSSGSNTYINATATVSLRLSNSPTLFINSSGVGLHKSVAFQSSVLSPSIGQNSNPTGVGQTLSISAQGSGDSAGGDFILSSGDGYASANDGSIRLRTSTNDRVLLSGVWSTGNASPIKFWPGQRTYFASFEEVSTALNLYLVQEGTTTTSKNYALRGNASTTVLNGSGSCQLGVNGIGLISLVSGAMTFGVKNLYYGINVTAPYLTHITRSTGNGETLTVQSQSTGDPSSSSLGGDLVLSSGNSLNGSPGNVYIKSHITTRAIFYNDGYTQICDVKFPPSRGAIGTVPKILDSSGNITWTAAGSGDVTGPASSTDSAITLFNGATGKVLKNSTVTIDGYGNISGAININSRRVASITTSAALSIHYYDYFSINSLTGNITIWLYSVPITGDCLIFKDSDGSLATYTLTLDGNGKTIDGDSTQIINTAYVSVMLVYNGTSWDIN